MGKSKSKRKAAAALANKAAKVAKLDPALTPPGTDSDASDGAPKHLSSVISNEELEIAIDTLATLSRYPGLIKSKACQPLRAAAYDFRSACTTGLNASQAVTASSNASISALTARVSAALADGRYKEARIALAEMRVREETPKLGALCRWVRDLDVVSGLSGAKGIHGRGTMSTREREGFKALDAVLRVTCPIDDASPVSTKVQDEMISLQPVWNLRDSSQSSEPVHEAAQEGTLFASIEEREETAAKYTVLETTPGPLRKPPNHHPAILYTSQPRSITLDEEPPAPRLHKHPIVPELSLVSSVLSPAECRAIVAAGEAVNFLPDAPLKDDTDDVSILAHNFYWVVDQDFHDSVWERVRNFVPAHVGGRLARGINRRFRVYRYIPGAEYRCHIDGAWPPSGISATTGEYQYDASEGKQSSLFTFLIYLNDDFEGGETTFFLPSVKDGVLNAYPVNPVMGGVAVFPHGDAKGALLHEGTGVRSGAKYVIRTDVEYDIEPTPGVAS